MTTQPTEPTVLSRIENLVNVITLRRLDPSSEALAPFEHYSDEVLAKMLCRLAVQYLDEVLARPGSTER